MSKYLFLYEEDKIRKWKVVDSATLQGSKFLQTLEDNKAVRNNSIAIMPIDENTNLLYTSSLGRKRNYVNFDEFEYDYNEHNIDVNKAIEEDARYGIIMPDGKFYSLHYGNVTALSILAQYIGREDKQLLKSLDESPSMSAGLRLFQNKYNCICIVVNSEHTNPYRIQLNDNEFITDAQLDTLVHLGFKDHPQYFALLDKVYPPDLENK